MIYMPNGKCRYRQLQSSGAPENLTSCKTDKFNYNGYGSILAFMVCYVRSIAGNVIIIATLFIPLMVSIQSSGYEFLFVKVLGGEKVFVYRGKLHSHSLSSWRWRFKAKSPCCRTWALFRGKQFSPPSQTLSICISCSLGQSFRLSIVISSCFVDSVALPTLLNMVHQSGRNRPRGHRGSGSLPIVICSENPEQSPVNLPPS